MKRYGGLFDKIVAMDNLELAFKKASKGKMWQRVVRHVADNKEEVLKEIQRLLQEDLYEVSPYRVKKVYEPKERDIFVLPFYPDRVIQHAVMNVVAPIWETFFIPDSYACRVGKGQHAGSTRCMQLAKQNRYVLQCDVAKFYPSIDTSVMMEVIQKKIKDARVLGLFEKLVRGGVPIGNYTSQWLGNLYLNELDQYLKHTHHVRDYIRYCDDFLIFSEDKAYLHTIAKHVETFLGSHLKLQLSRCRVYPTRQGVDFLGYRCFPSGKKLLRKTTKKSIQKRLKAIPYEVQRGTMTAESAIAKIASAEGVFRWGHCYHLREALGIEALKKEVLSWRN